ncbi:MAG TPA: LysM peptidoglycan-binding domain-containing protein, partial [Thermoleophilaceae bacterium]|nr:LysM peptidoglycan-binding domain-containing protein [Thermoleophilaceae bacterium]
NNLTTRALASANGLPAEAQTVQELASLNDLDPTGTLLIGTRLRLPTGAPAAPPAAVASARFPARP